MIFEFATFVVENRDVAVLIENDVVAVLKLNEVADALTKGNPDSNITIRNRIFFDIFTSPRRNRSQEVVPVILLQPGSHWRSGIKPV